MTTFDVLIPALTLRTSRGAIDFPATRRYAERAARTWVDYFIISGSTTQGHALTADERAAIIDLWLEVAEPSRLLPCCWEPNDFHHAAIRQLTPMAVLHSLDSREGITFLRQLPHPTTIYSHPMFQGAVFDAALARAAREADALPVGGKLAKVSTSDVRAIHRAAGDAFRLWDGSSRRIASSLLGGAAGIVATPLSPFFEDFPEKSTSAIQAAVDPIQRQLDGLATRAERTSTLMQCAISCS